MVPDDGSPCSCENVFLNAAIPIRAFLTSAMHTVLGPPIYVEWTNPILFAFASSHPCGLRERAKQDDHYFTPSP